MAFGSEGDVLLRLVPDDGTSVGNVKLLSQLRARGWSDEKYWEVRDKLLLAGALLRGRGRGGSVRRPIEVPPERPPQTQTVEPAPASAPSSSPEAALYEPLLRVLSTDWAREMRIDSDQIHFEITARQGKRGAGTWTRPDITAASVRTFQYLPGKYLDIWTFEVKPVEYLDITGVFEAAAHAGRATRSYALLQISNDTSDVQDLLDRCERESARLRVGLITFTNPAEFATWETRVEAPRNDTDPELLEEFIAQLSETAKKKLSKWK